MLLQNPFYDFKVARSLYRSELNTSWQQPDFPRFVTQVVQQHPSVNFSKLLAFEIYTQVSNPILSSVTLFLPACEQTQK